MRLVQPRTVGFRGATVTSKAELVLPRRSLRWTARRRKVSMTTSILLLRSGVLSITVGAYLLWALPTPEASAQINSIQLFDAVPVTKSGPVTNEVVTFGETELVLACPAVPSATISSDPEGTAPVVVDNFLTVNGRNVCPG